MEILSEKHGIKLDNEIIDTIDLKALLVSRGIKVSNPFYWKYEGQVRLSTNPLECNTIILPDSTIVQLTDLAFYTDYIKSAISWDTIRQLKYFSQIKTNFRLDLDEFQHTNFLSYTLGRLFVLRKGCTYIFTVPFNLNANSLPDLNK